MHDSVKVFSSSSFLCIFLYEPTNKTTPKRNEPHKISAQIFSVSTNQTSSELENLTMTEPTNKMSSN